MISFSPELLQSELDNIRKGIAKLLSLSGDQLVSGIVSNYLETEEPSQLSVTWNSDTNRLIVTPGVAVTPAGNAVTLNNELSDLIWPEERRLYLVIQAGSISEMSQDRFWREQISIITSTASIALIEESAYLVMDKSNLVILAVLTRADIELDVDTTSIYFDDNRPNYTLLDLEHRSEKGSHTTDFNPHGIELGDLEVGNMTLLKQTTATGYVMPIEDDIGIPGRSTTLTFNDFWFDGIGRHVAPGNYYVQLQYTPTALPKIVDADGLMVDFDWIERTPYLQLGTTRPNPITVTWASVHDLDTVTRDNQSDLIDIRGINDGPIVADGISIEPSATTFDCGPYAGLSLDLNLGLDANKKPTFVPPLLDSAILSSKKSMSIDPVALHTRSQFAFALTNSPNRNALPPPNGSIVLSDSSFMGTYRLMFTVSCPAISENLHFTSSSETAYSASVTGWHGAIFRDGKPLANRYWNRIGNVVYLDARAYHDHSVYQYQAQASETARFRNRYIEVVGTASIPTGIAAEASLELLTADLDIGDMIRVTFENGNSPVVLFATQNFVVETDINSTLLNIAVALNNNHLFARRCTTSISGSVLSIMSKKLGVDGNAYSLQATSKTGNKFDVSTFTGGGPYKPNAYDPVGMTFFIDQPPSDLPPGASVNAYITNRIQVDTDATKFFKMTTAQIGLSSIRITSAMVDSIDHNTVYDLDKKLSLTVQISGLDQNNTSATETIVIDDVDCFEPIEPLKYRSELKCSTNVWSKLTSWMVSDSKNIGSTKLFVLGSPSARDAGIVNVAAVQYYNSTRSVLDNRVLKPSTLNDAPSDQASALIGGLTLRAFR